MFAEKQKHKETFKSNILIFRLKKSRRKYSESQTIRFEPQKKALPKRRSFLI